MEEEVDLYTESVEQYIQKHVKEDVYGTVEAIYAAKRLPPPASHSSPLERHLFMSLNLVRTYPRIYVHLMLQHAEFEEEMLFLKSGESYPISYETLHDVLFLLNEQKPVNSLEWHSALYRAC